MGNHWFAKGEQQACWWNGFAITSADRFTLCDGLRLHNALQQLRPKAGGIQRNGPIERLLASLGCTLLEPRRHG